MIFFEKEQLTYVILTAAKVEGIHATNTFIAEFIYDNYHPKNSHVQPALIRRTVLAEKLTNPLLLFGEQEHRKEELLHVDNL